MQKLLLFSVALLCCFACAEIPKKETPKKEETPVVVNPPVVGGDVDAHGCKPSAGYTWSALKGECIRIFESGVRLNPKAPELDATTSAFIVFKSLKAVEQVELYLPGQKETSLLQKDTKVKNQKWANEMHVLTWEKGSYTLADVKGKVLYESEKEK